MNFYVQILGSGAALPTLNRNCSGQYVFCNNRHILIDCGEGTQIQLRKFKIHLQRISHILISHLHGDHFFGLPGLISTMSLLGRTKGICIYGPKNLKNLLISMLEATGNKLSFELTFVELELSEKQNIFEDNLIKISAFPLKHRIPTFGFLIEENQKPYRINISACEENNVGKQYFYKLKKGELIEIEGKCIKNEILTFPPDKSFSYAYCSDTTFDLGLVKTIKGVDVLYHESTFLQEHTNRANKTFHSTALQAATIAKECEARRLILGHFSSRYKDVSDFEKEAKSVFSNSVIAEEGLKIIIDDKLN